MGEIDLYPGLGPDLTFAAELADAGDEDPIFEMVNLPEKQTGVEGVIFISTAAGKHGPRVKYYVRAGAAQRSFSVSISSEPRVLANSLPAPVLNRTAPQVIRWVALNHEALLDFWNDGETWMHDEVSAFVAKLKRL